jgi:hypothetical protein
MCHAKVAVSPRIWGISRPNRYPEERGDAGTLESLPS